MNKKTRAENLFEVLKDRGYKARLVKTFSYEVDKNRSFYTVEIADMSIEAIRVGLDFGYKFQADIMNRDNIPALVYNTVPCVGKEYEFVEEE